MNAGLQVLHGHNIRDAINVLGYPTSQGAMAGDRVYTWDTQGPLVAGAFPVGNSTFAFAGVLYCRITLGTDSEGTIVHEEWQGNNGGCMQWSRRLGGLTQR
jgi:hypothetical protein